MDSADRGDRERNVRLGLIVAAAGVLGVVAIGIVAFTAATGGSSDAALLDAGHTPIPTPTAAGTFTATPEPPTPTATPEPPTATPEPPTPVPTDAPPASTGSQSAPQGSLAGESVWSDGDSTSYFMTVAFLASAVAMGATQAIPADYHISSGFISGSTRDGRDWLTYLADEVAAHDPSIMVLMLGANDAVVFSSPSAYAAKVSEAMDIMHGRRVIWLGQPNMSPQGGYSVSEASIRAVNTVFQQEAGRRPWVTYIDTWSLTSVGSEAWGEIDWSIRAADGVHLSSAGGARLADAVLAAILSD